MKKGRERKGGRGKSGRGKGMERKGREVDRKVREGWEGMRNIKTREGREETYYNIFALLKLILRTWEVQVDPQEKWWKN